MARKKRSADVQEGNYDFVFYTITQHYNNVRRHEFDILDIGSILGLRQACKAFRDLIDSKQKGIVRFFSGLDAEKANIDMTSVLWSDLLYLSSFHCHDMDVPSLMAKREVMKQRFLRFPGMEIQPRMSKMHLLGEANSVTYVLFYTNDFNLVNPKAPKMLDGNNRNIFCRFICWLNDLRINKMIFRRWFFDGKFDLIVSLCECGGMGPFDRTDGSTFVIQDNDMESHWQMIIVCFMMRYLVREQKKDLKWAIQMLSESCRNPMSNPAEFNLFFYLLGRTKNDTFLTVPSAIQWFSGFYFLKKVSDGFNNKIFPTYSPIENATKNILWLDDEGHMIDAIPPMSTKFGEAEHLEFKRFCKQPASYREAESAFLLGALHHTSPYDPCFMKLNSFRSCFFGESARGKYSMMLAAIFNFAPIHHERAYEKVLEDYLDDDVSDYWPWKEAPNLDLAAERHAKWCIERKVDLVEMSRTRADYLKLDCLFGNFLMEYDGHLYSRNIRHPSEPFFGGTDPTPLEIVRFIQKQRVSKEPPIETGNKKKMIQDKKQDLGLWFLKQNSYQRKTKLFTLAANDMILSLNPIERLDYKINGKLVTTLQRSLLYVFNLTPIEAKSIYKESILDRLKPEDWQTLYRYRPIVFFSLVLNQNLDWIIDCKVIKDCFFRSMEQNLNGDTIYFFVCNLQKAWSLDGRAYGLLDKLYREDPKEAHFWWEIWRTNPTSYQSGVMLGLLSPCPVLEQVFDFYSQRLLDAQDLIMAVRKSTMSLQEKNKIAKRYGISSIKIRNPDQVNEEIDQWFKSL